MKSDETVDTSTITNKKKKKVSYYKKPDNMSIDQWQIELRKQFALDQNFEINNIGNHPVFSDFKVYNTESRKIYKVSIRNKEYGMNFCSCPDFKINGLRTCKHIEYVLYKLKNIQQNEKYWGKEADLDYSSVSLRYEKQRKIYLRIGSNRSDQIKKLARNYFDADGYLLPSALYSIDEFVYEAYKIDQDFRIYPDALEYIKNKRNADNREKLMKKYSLNGNNNNFKDLLKVNLYPFQKEGVIKAVKAGRVLIADEMGLGKTIQAIASAEILANELGIEKVLIICPTSLKYQWQMEINKFTNREVNVIEGLIHKRRKQYEDNQFYKIISYGVVRSDLEFINKFAPDLVILDEAQRIKNWKTKIAQSIKQISSEYAIVLTGTPLENRLEELHSIVEFIDRYKLGPLFRFLYTHQIIDEFGKIIGYTKLHDINETLDPILVRRTKKEIEDQLPDRLDKNFFVKMTKEQLRYHSDYYEIVSRLVNKWRRQGFLSEEDRDKLLIALSCMRMVCDSTYILDQKTRHDTKIDELVIILEEVLENKDEKIVIFSQWKRMTELVADELGKMNIGYEYLHGDIPSAKRKEIIDNFHHNRDSRVFLSTDVGGVGLNLQCANIVINIDIPWNPAVLEQRVARVYRLGQKKHVRVINMVSKFSIEHKILHLLKFKKSVFKGVLDKEKDTVLMDSGKFGEFMEQLENMMDNNTEGRYFSPFTSTSSADEKDNDKIKNIPDPNNSNHVALKLTWFRIKLFSRYTKNRKIHKKTEPFINVQTGTKNKFRINIRSFIRRLTSLFIRIRNKKLI
jgi:SNF2 family DNA or RNA helicase